VSVGGYQLSVSLGFSCIKWATGYGQRRPIIHTIDYSLCILCHLHGDSAIDYVLTTEHHDIEI